MARELLLLKHIDQEGSELTACHSITRMAQQQKNNPGLIFADRNLNPYEYEDDVDDDDETYYDNDNNDEEDQEALDFDKEEDNDNGDNEMAAHGAPMVDDEEDDNDDDDNGMAAHGPPMVDAPLLDNLAQPLDNPPGEIPGVEAANEAGEYDVAMEPEIPGVGEKRLNWKSQEWMEKRMEEMMMLVQCKTRLQLSSH